MGAAEPNAKEEEEDLRFVSSDLEEVLVGEKANRFGAAAVDAKPSTEEAAERTREIKKKSWFVNVMVKKLG
jgi:hypothetical protein